MEKLPFSNHFIIRNRYRGSAGDCPGGKGKGTGAIAGVLVLVVVNIFPPAAGTSIQFASAQMEEMSSVGDMIVGALTVDDFSGLMSRRNMLPIIVFAILSGFCVSACGGEESPVGKLLNNLNAIIMKIVSIIMMYAPIGLGAYFASLVGEFGPGLIGDYGHAMLVYYPCLLYTSPSPRD